MNTKPKSEIIYHMDPDEVVLRYPDLVGTVLEESGGDAKKVRRCGFTMQCIL